MCCEWCVVWIMKAMNYPGLFGYKVKGLGFRLRKTGDVTVVCTDD